MNNTLKAQFKIGLILGMVAVLVMIGRSCQAQKPKLMQIETVKEINAMMKDYPSIAHNKFLLFRADTTIDQRRTISFIFHGEHGKAVEFRFFKNEIRGNQDLQVPSKSFYSLEMASGLFLDLLPFWQKYFNPKATQEVLLKNMIEVIIFKDDSGGEDRVVFQKDAPNWLIVKRG